MYGFFLFSVRSSLTFDRKVTFVQLFPRPGPDDPYGPVWSRMVLHGPVCFHLVLIGLVLSGMVPFGPVWSFLVLFCPV